MRTIFTCIRFFSNNHLFKPKIHLNTTAKMSIRAAKHAGSWYEEDPRTLSEQLDGWLSKVPDNVKGDDLPIPGARVIIAP